MEGGGPQDHRADLPAGELRERVTKITPGQKFVYVSDVIDSPAMSGRIVEFARGADVLFVEACFLDEDRGRAEEKYHLTAGRRGDWPGLPG